MVFFLCFYSIVVTHRNCNFSIAFPLFHACFTRQWSHIGASILLGIILPSPYSFRFASRFNQFSKRSTQIFHCFPIFFPLFYVKVPSFFHCCSHHFPLLSHFFPIVLCHIPSFFLLFFSSFSPPLQSAQIHLGGRTRGESIPQRRPIATWYITLKKFTCGHLFYHLISSFLSLSGRSAPRPP